jgi:hypothetical protein
MCVAALSEGKPISDAVLKLYSARILPDSIETVRLARGVGSGGDTAFSLSVQRYTPFNTGAGATLLASALLCVVWVSEIRRILVGR